MKNKVCYVVSFWLGKRRVEIQEYDDNKFFFLEKQLYFLEKFKNNIDTVVFNFNLVYEHFDLFTHIFNLLPKKIKNSKIEINVRQNVGMSYGGFSEVFLKYRNDFDYFIFNEDDYIFIEHNWDSYLLNKFKSTKNCGYLSMIVSESDSSYPKHASHSTGISSSLILNKLIDNFGELPHSKSEDYFNNELYGQIKQTNEIVKLGYDIFDVRDDYKVLFLNHEKQIIEYHKNNHKILIQPSHLN